MKIRLSHLTTNLLGSLAEQTIMSSEKPVYAMVANHPLLVALKEEHANFVAVFGKDAYSGMGSAVVKADVLRDAAFAGMKSLLLGYAKLPGFEFQQEAADLYHVFEVRGLDINTFNYNSESTEMDKLISDLSKPENLTKLEHLNMIPYFEGLKTAENDFKLIYSQQLGANSNLRKMLSATSTRRNLEDALRSYFAIVEGMKKLEGWADLYLELNVLVTSIRNARIDTKQVLPPPPAATK
jgi:hypothetical protein